MKAAIQNIPDDIKDLKEMVLSQQVMVEKLQRDFTEIAEWKNVATEREYTLLKKCDKQENYIESLLQDIDKLRKMVFGPSSEKYITEVPAEQLTIFDIPGEEPPAEDEQQTPEEELEEIQYSRKKKKPGRKRLSESIPREEVEHDLPEKDKLCACGKCRPLMGCDTNERLAFTPATLVVEIHSYPKYGECDCQCHEKEELPAVIATPKEPRMIPKSITTPSLLAYIFTSKFVDGMPFYRLDKQFKRYGASISRQNMSNWAIKVLPQLERLLPFLKEHILSGQIINMDETPFQVLSEPGRKATTKSYMWLMHGGPPGAKATLYKYSPSRSGTVAVDLLGDYVGCVQTDAYAAYLYLNKKEGVLHVTCMAHVRRKFLDLQISLNRTNKKKYKKSSNHVDKIMGLIGQLYTLESRFRDEGQTDVDLVKARQKEAKPVFDQLQTLVKGLYAEVPPETIFGKALSYAVKNLPLIEQYLSHDFIGLDNNSVENEVRPFAIGRKNWLFSGNVAGANASAAIHSFVQSAKLNELNPYEYLKYIFKKLPEVETDEDLKKLLPFDLTDEEMQAANIQ